MSTEADVSKTNIHMLNAKQDNPVSEEENDSKQNECSRKSAIKLTDNTDTSPWTPVWYKL